MYVPSAAFAKASSQEREPWNTLCHCACHPPQKPPPAVEARLCAECADERFKSWDALIKVLMRDD